MLRLPDEHEGPCECLHYLMNTRALANVAISVACRRVLFVGELITMCLHVALRSFHLFVSVSNLVK